MKKLTLRMKINDFWSDSINDLFKEFARLYSKEIMKFTGCGLIGSDVDQRAATEFSIENFGPGSAWIHESPFTLKLSFLPEFIVLTIEK